MLYFLFILYLCRPRPYPHSYSYPLPYQLTAYNHYPGARLYNEINIDNAIHQRNTKAPYEIYQALRLTYHYIVRISRGSPVLRKWKKAPAADSLSSLVEINQKRLKSSIPSPECILHHLLSIPRCPSPYLTRPGITKFLWEIIHFISTTIRSCNSKMIKDVYFLLLYPGSRPRSPVPLLLQIGEEPMVALSPRLLCYYNLDLIRAPLSLAAHPKLQGRIR